MTNIVRRLSHVPRLIAAGAALILLAVSAIMPFAQAQAAGTTAQVAQSPSGQAFSISPPLLQLKADPGQTVTAELTLTNISASTLQVNAEVNDFGAKDELGDPNILFNDSNSTPYAIHNWVQLPQSFTIASKASKKVDFPIVVPKNAEPGGHYGVLRFTGGAPGGGASQVSLSASIGTLVLLQVSGNVTESASVVQMYSATTKNDTMSSFFQNGPVNFVTRIKDTGNTHLAPTGTIDVTNMLGRKTASLDFNGNPKDAKNQPKIVLPASIRRFENTLNKKWLFGRYTATLHATYGDKNTPITTKTTFWVIPYKLVAIVLVVLILIILLLRWMIKRYNRHIINRAKGGQGGPSAPSSPSAPTPPPAPSAPSSTPPAGSGVASRPGGAPSVPVTRRRFY
jgi:hypothetical protein